MHGSELVQSNSRLNVCLPLNNKLGQRMLMLQHIFRMRNNLHVLCRSAWGHYDSEDVHYAAEFDTARHEQRSTSH